MPRIRDRFLYVSFELFGLTQEVWV